MTFLEVFLGVFSREKSPANNTEFILLFLLVSVKREVLLPRAFKGSDTSACLLLY